MMKPARYQFGQATPMPAARPCWKRTDWSMEAGIAIGICSMIVMVACFYIIL